MLETPCITFPAKQIDKGVTAGTGAKAEVWKEPQSLSRIHGSEKGNQSVFNVRADNCYSQKVVIYGATAQAEVWKEPQA